jgi:hypothetical protein
VPFVITVRVVDAYGSVMDKDDTTNVEIYPEDGTVTQITGNTKVRVTQGVAVFDYLIITTKPGNSIGIKFKTDSFTPDSLEELGISAS